MSGHTEGRLRVIAGDGCQFLCAPDGVVAVVEQRDRQTDKSNAARLVAAWNGYDSMREALAITPDPDPDACDNCPPTCHVCGSEYSLRDGCDPSPECDPCAHVVLSNARAALAREAASMTPTEADAHVMSMLRTDLAYQVQHDAKVAAAVRGCVDALRKLADLARDDSRNQAHAYQREAAATRESMAREALADWDAAQGGGE